MNFICPACHATYDATPHVWRCASCGSHLELSERKPFRADGARHEVEGVGRDLCSQHFERRRWRELRRIRRAREGDRGS